MTDEDAIDPPEQNDYQRVLDRIKQEAAQLAPLEKPPKITSKLIEECLFANVVGDAVLYATVNRDKFIYSKKAQEWYAWNTHYWEPDVMHESLVAVENIVPLYLAEFKRVSTELAELLATGEDVKSEKSKKLISKRDRLLSRAHQLRDDKRRTACLKFAHTIANGLAIKGDEFDLHPWLFPCKNGVIDLKRGDINPGNPRDYLSLASPIEFLGIDTPAPLWDKTLLEIFNGKVDMVDFLQRLFGYFMTGVIQEKIFPVLFGRSGFNGRSVIVEMISYVMGDLAAVIQSEMLLSQKFGKSSAGPSPDIMALKGVRMAFASEVDEGQRFSSAKIKWLTGNDSLVGRGLQEKKLTKFKPTHKLLLMTNSQPTAAAKDTPFWERMLLIPFEISFVNREPLERHERRANLNLAAELIKEAPGILAWLVRGCLFWQLYGLQPPLAVKEASAKYRQNEDMMGDFLDECCLREPTNKVQAAVIYQRFVDWYHLNIGKGDKLTGTWFGKQLSNYFEKTKINGLIYYLGVDLKP